MHFAFILEAGVFRSPPTEQISASESLLVHRPKRILGNLGRLGNIFDCGVVIVLIEETSCQLNPKPNFVGRPRTPLRFSCF